MPEAVGPVLAGFMIRYGKWKPVKAGIQLSLTLKLEQEFAEIIGHGSHQAGISVVHFQQLKGFLLERQDTAGRSPQDGYSLASIVYQAADIAGMIAASCLSLSIGQQRQSTAVLVGYNHFQTVAVEHPVHRLANPGLIKFGGAAVKKDHQAVFTKFARVLVNPGSKALRGETREWGQRGDVQQPVRQNPCWSEREY